MGGTITNSDLEQLALVCHPDVLTSHHDIREHTICALSDNTAAVSRDRRGSTSVNAPSAYLCRLASIHQRAHRYRLNADYLPGSLNIMADDLSRRWDLSDSQILAYFNSTYPQTQSWRLCHSRPALISTATKALWMQHCDPASLSADKLQLPPTGISGPTSVSKPSELTRTFVPTSRLPSSKSRLLSLLAGPRPAMPKPDASTVRRKVGAESTTSAQWVGRAVSSWASQRKSSSWSWTGWERRSRSVGFGFFACRSMDWSWEKRPRPPGMANTMLRSSPSSCCHFRWEVRCWERDMDCRISWRRASRWDESSIVRAMVSIVQPKKHFRVDQAASPLSNFLMVVVGGGWRRWL
jgi:hypothetical protein